MVVGGGYVWLLSARELAWWRGMKGSLVNIDITRQKCLQAGAALDGLVTSPN